MINIFKKIPFFVKFYSALIAACALFSHYFPIGEPGIIIIGAFFLIALLFVPNMFVKIFFGHLEYRRQNRLYGKVQERINIEAEAKRENSDVLSEQRAFRQVRTVMLNKKVLINQEIYRPSVAIIVPVYNEEPDMVLALINRCVSQKGLKCHTYIIDDGSQNYESLERRAYSKFEHRDDITIVHQKNQGKRTALLTAFNLATEDILVLSDSDCFFEDDYGATFRATFS